VKTIGVTGAAGFLGSHLVARLQKERFLVREINRADFADMAVLAEKVAVCDDIVHFAGLSRHENGEYLYRTNLELGEKLVCAACRKAGNSPRLILASTTHIDRETPYHQAKRDLAALFRQSGKKSVELLMPNVFGANGKPFYNSVVSTFCRLCADGKTPERIDDVELALIYVDSLMDEIVEILCDGAISGRVRVADEYHVGLIGVWHLLTRLKCGATPANDFERDLAATLSGYLKNSR